MAENEKKDWTDEELEAILNSVRTDDEVFNAETAEESDSRLKVEEDKQEDLFNRMRGK